MFNIYASLFVIVGLAAVYVIIRIKHGGPLLDSPHTWWDWIVAFRSWVVGLVGGLALSLPDILVQVVPGLDLTWLVGDNWSRIIVGALSTFLLFNTALKTKPGNTPAA